jgi:hypothetical protein
MYPKKYVRIILFGYVYVLDGIVTANGAVGISGSRSSPYENKTFIIGKAGRAQRQQPVSPGRYCKQF